MKVEYDKPIPVIGQSNGIYVKEFYKFYNSNHQTARVEFETEKEAKMCQQSICGLRNRKKDMIVDFKQKRVKNVIYWEKENVSESMMTGV